MRKRLSVVFATGPVHRGIAWRLFPLAFLFAGVLIWVIQRLWNPHQRYPDVVTGALAYQNFDKSKELILLMLLLAISVLFYYILLRLTATSIRSFSGHSEWVCAWLDIPLACLAYWTAFQLVRFDGSEPPIEAVASAGVLFGVLLALRRFSSLSPRIAQRVGPWVLFDLVLLAFGGFGIGLIAAFTFPSKQLHPGSIAVIYFLCGLCFLVIICLRSDPVKCVQRLSQATYVFQVPLPLLFFTVLQRDTVQHGVKTIEASSRILEAAICLLCLAAWWLLYRRYFRQRKLRPGRLRAHTQPLCLSAIAVCLAGSNTYFPEIYSDDFHLGEQLLPWQQLTQFGKLPYIDLIPIHGVMPLLRGAINSLFFDGSVATFESASNLLGAGAAAITFLCLFRAGGLAPPLLYCLCPATLDRFYVFGPILLWMTQPRLYRSPVRGLMLGAALMAFALVYNVPVGGALIIGLFPVVIQETARAWRDRAARMRLLVGVTVLLVAVLAIPWARHTVSGFVGFAAENGVVNTIANDIPWSGIPAVSAPSPEVITSPLLFAGLKFGWIPIALLTIVLLVNAAAARLHSLARARNRLLWAVALSCLFMLPWTAGRIDPGMSRTGMFSAYCAAVFLPIIAVRFQVASRYARMQPTAVFVAIAAVLGLYAPETDLVTTVKSIALHLSPVVTVPNDLVRVVGSEHGLPNLGALYMNRAKLDELTSFNGALSNFAGDRGTYFDLTNRQALYAFCRRETLTVYPAAYIAASHQQQEHVLSQLKANPPKIVFVSPALKLDGPQSLRSYLLYRYAVLNFQPCPVRGNVFMLDPSLDRSHCENIPDAPLLDESFSFDNLHGLPSAWGASWSSLEPLFDGRPVSSFPSRVKTHDLNWDGQQFTVPGDSFDERAYLALYPDVAAAVAKGMFPNAYAHFVQIGRSEGRAVPGIKRPFFWVVLQDLNINPREFDFLTFRFSCGSCTMTKIPFEVRWKPDGAGSSKPIAFTVDGDRVLLPMGSSPQWLTAKTIAALRLDMTCPECLRSFRVTDLTLLHYKPSKTVPNALGEKPTGQKPTAPLVLSNATIKGVIDAPKDGDILAGDFVVGGWAIAYDGTIKNVWVSVDGKPPVAAGASVPRPDVARANLEVPNAQNSGWNLVVPVGDIKAGKHQVAVTVGLQDGTQEPLGTVNVPVTR
jgi:hypothetical protein